MGKLQYFNRQLGLACSLIALSSFNYGFDNQAFATTQAMDAFGKQFGVFNPKTQTWALEPSWLSQFNSLNYIGFAAGVLIGSEISSRFGRRWCMFSMSCYALVTATIAVTSTSKSQIMSARVLNYLYVGMELSVVPAYQSEIVPAPVRGLIVGTYQLSLVLGGFVINSVCRGTSTINDNKSWRIPLGLFYVIPVIIASLIWFIPESPRWLLLKGRRGEAEANLIKLREGAFSQEDIQKEFAELTSTLETEVEQGHFKECFQGLNLKRTILVVLLNMFQQATGQAFASQYGTIYVKSLGTINPFNFSLILASVNIVSISVALLLTDRIGRR
ncbi:hypothetical protein LTS08_007115 [Lithohypha guttulata]|uniref:Major facilitator superfamily (MFS) profile domain-containing protein n=1 Tax=Lithohypha guttulata TaxID=1690604 RepID=A0AAN7YH48_9EURO|nr:hypothetical protein LTR05_003869 [Lithohypha guttulata]KAK5097095.1 hypothetical protein LTS08_007115 [Lithohypha guttulata]